jgi:UDP-galactopyranose mutase
MGEIKNLNEINNRYDYVIVGAGLFGITFARCVAESGKKSLIIEKRNHIGGNVYDEFIDNINVHMYGPHIFHTSYKSVWNFVNRFARFNNYVHMPMACYDNKIYNLPFNMNTFIRLFKGCTNPREVQEAIDKERFTGTPTNLEEYALSMVGKTIYTTLIEAYTEKQWGTLCDRLPMDIIKRIPLRMTFDNRYFTDRYQGIPIEGYTAMCKNICNHDNIDIIYNTDFNDIKSSWKDYGNKLIYTGMIDEFYDYKFGELKYRSLRFETKTIINCQNYKGTSVMNFTDYTPYTRITEHKHFCPENIHYMDNKTVITYEYPTLYRKNENVPFYPVNDITNENLYKQYKQLADNNDDIYFCGRLGEYKYYDMDDTIAAAMQLAIGEINE